MIMTIRERSTSRSKQQIKHKMKMKTRLTKRAITLQRSKSKTIIFRSQISTFSVTQISWEDHQE